MTGEVLLRLEGSKAHMQWSCGLQAKGVPLPAAMAFLSYRKGP